MKLNTFANQTSCLFSIKRHPITLTLLMKALQLATGRYVESVGYEGGAFLDLYSLRPVGLPKIIMVSLRKQHVDHASNSKVVFRI